MSAKSVFFDSNVVLYLFSAHGPKAEQAEKLMADGGVISVQVLNEVAHVSRRKLSFSWLQTHEVLNTLRSVCRIEPLQDETHRQALVLAQRYGLSVYDGLIAAAAIQGRCQILYSEDMHDGLVMLDQLKLVNPFLLPANQ